TPQCTLDFSLCPNPPPSSTTTTTTTTTTTLALCGNGHIDAGEQCDGTDINGATCPDGSAGGALVRCTPECTLDFSLCPPPTTTTSTATTPTTTPTQPPCGNGHIDAGEACDGTDIDGATCPDGSRGGAFVRCTPECTLDFSLCPAPTTTTTTSSSTTTSSTA